MPRVASAAQRTTSCAELDDSAAQRTRAGWNIRAPQAVAHGNLRPAPTARDMKRYMVISKLLLRDVEGYVNEILNQE